MQKTNEIIQGWKNECKKPFYIVHSIEISKSDFNLMIKEIEELQLKVDQQEIYKNKAEY